VRSAEEPGEPRCGSCGNPVAAGDAYCTHCGASLHDATNLLHLGVKPPTAPGAAPVASASRQCRPWVLLVTLAAVSLVALGLVAALVVGRQQLDETRAERDAATAEVADLTAARDRLAGELAATRTLSKRRAAVLAEADEVLRGVDPLLASVDDVKQRAAVVEGGGDSFVGATNSLIETTIELVNYLVGTDPDQIDVQYVNDLVDAANAQLDRVSSLESALQASHESYGKAAARFDTRATAFSSAVERLKRQLEQVAR
jgi:hypothetical protein